MDEIRLGVETASDEAFIGLLVTHFNPQIYLELHPDVAQAGADPLEHWLRHGLEEGRWLAPNVEVRRVDDVEALSGRKWTLYRWRDNTVMVRIRIPLSAESTSQDVERALLTYEATPEEEAFVGFLIEHFNPKIYLELHPDVASAGVDPLEQWLQDGLREGRRLSPAVDVLYGKDAEAASDRKWKRYRWREKTVTVLVRIPLSAESSQQDVERALLTYEATPEEEPFIGFLMEQFNPKTYLELHPDVANAGVDPLEHWLRYGLEEGRRLSSTVEVLHGKDADSITRRGWRQYRWREEFIAVRVFQSVPKSITTQILNQARHDPAVLAPGERAVANLRQFDATDLQARDGIDFAAIVAGIKENPEVVIIMPFLCIGGAEKYTADLVSALYRTGVRSIQVFVTDQASGGNPDWKSLAILKSFQSVDVLFWPDVSTDSSNAVTLARLLNGLRPRLTFVVNSRVGLNMVAKFGRGLSQNSRLFCAYFSLGVQAVGPTFGNRFPRYTLPFAAALTDNELTAATLRSRYCKLHAHDVVVLPPQVTPASDDEFNGRLTSRRCRSAGVARQLRWVWVGRIESWKGTRILSKLARLRPLDRFELFGPIFQSLADFELAQQNVFHFGELESVLEADMSNYDGFLFTSLFEGMSNVVLEMSQHAIPLVLTKVGGLPETFNEEAVFFVGIGNEEDTATAFSAALDQVSSLLPEAATTMAIAARNQALRRHSPAAFQHNVTTLFGR